MPGALWLGYQMNGDEALRSKAIARQRPIAKLRPTASMLDLGQRYYYSMARAYDLTGVKSYRNSALAAATQQAARFSSRAGTLRSRNTTSEHRVIVDEMMNTQLLFWAARHGGSPLLRDMAQAHARTAARDFVREDGSTYHVVDYDLVTGGLIGTSTAQGYSASSMWSRGQAWAIYGFTNAYKETGDPLFLDTARRVADAYWSELPSDTVPFWDFRDPAIPDAPRDSSAAAIAASGLIALSLVETDSARAAECAERAKASIAALLSPRYQSADRAMVLRNGTLNYYSEKTRGCALSFGDYFFAEALMRLRLLPTDMPEVAPRRVKSPVGAPYRATDHRGTTWWSARGKRWIQLDMGSRTGLSGVGIALVDGDSRSAAFKVLVSNDKKRWRTVAKVRSSAMTASLERYEFRTTRGRFVRIECNGTSRNSIARISEIRIY